MPLSSLRSLSAALSPAPLCHPHLLFLLLLPLFSPSTFTTLLLLFSFWHFFSCCPLSVLVRLCSCLSTCMFLLFYRPSPFQRCSAPLRHQTSLQITFTCLSIFSSVPLCSSILRFFVVLTHSYALLFLPFSFPHFIQSLCFDFPSLSSLMFLSYLFFLPSSIIFLPNFPPCFILLVPFPFTYSFAFL